jgi:D-ornithine 4,5-aminomutase subunit alpha
MEKLKVRTDDFETRRNHLRDLSDQELYDLFWKYANDTVKPLIKLAYNHTTPAIERSVLLRMGFSSLEAKILVDKTIDHQLMGKGAGHVVYRYSKLADLPLRDAGLQLMKDLGWDKVLTSFGVKPC